MEAPPTTYTVNGAAIRRRRMEAGLEPDELAERAGISRRYLNHLENGTRKRMRPRRYHALCTALNATDHQLLASEDHIPEEVT